MITGQNRRGGVICAYSGFCLLVACQAFASQVWPQSELLALASEPEAGLEAAANPQRPPVVPDYFEDTTVVRPEPAPVEENAPESKKNRRRSPSTGKRKTPEAKPVEAPDPEEMPGLEPTPEEPAGEEAPSEEITEPKRRFWFFKRRDKTDAEEVPVEESDPSDDDGAGEETMDVEDDTDVEETPRKERRFLFFGRRDKTDAEDAPAEEPEATDEDGSDKNNVQIDDSEEEKPEAKDEDEAGVETPAPAKRRFLFFGRRDKTEPEESLVEAPEADEEDDSEEMELPAEEPEADQRDAPPPPAPVDMAKPAPVEEDAPVMDPPGAQEEVKPEVTTPVVRVPVLRTGMLLDITVLVAGEKEIEEASKRIETDGTVSLPLVGKFPAADKTLSEFQETLCERYDEQFFVNPQVVVDFSREGDEYASPWGHVTVLGAVHEPGRISIPPTQDLAVSQAIQAAGGCTDVAKISDIRVSRPGENDKSQKFRVNLQDVGAKGLLQDDLLLEPGDVVFVPEAMF